MPAIDAVEYLQNAPAPGYSARQLRQSFVDICGEGVFGSADYRVTFSAGLTVTVASGEAYVRGASTALQGLYKCDLAASKTVTLPAADATNPRIDQIVLQVRDSAEDGGASNDGQVTFIAGTPAPGATLDNRAGAAPLTVSSPSLIVLADVLVNAGNSPALSSTNIRDRRSFGLQGVVPSSVSNAVKDQVMFINPAIPNIAIRWDASWSSKQSAFAMYLPRRIAATHMRWRYVQGSNNSTAAYNMAICDASGRLIAQAGSVNLAGAIGTSQRPVLPFNPALPAGYIFDAGWYYVWAGVATFGVGASIGFPGYNADNGTITAGNNSYASPALNMVFKSNTGDATFPASNTILGMGDAYNDTSGTNCLPMPQIALSVG
jgi:hypothetical protein